MRRTVMHLAALALTAGPAFAQGEEAAGKTNLLSVNGGLMFWTLVIFIILLVVLSKYAFGPITAAVEAREAALEEAITGAKRDRDEAARLLAEQRRQIEAARVEAQRIIAESGVTGEKLRLQMLDETRQQQQGLIERAKLELQSEKDKAILELRREAVELAIAGASKVIERNLDDQGNRRLVDEYLASLAQPAGR
jgi:F-type H+-transporting ATPase subunit b